MPPLTWGGVSFLISWDDLTIPALIAVAIHLVWFVLDTSQEAHYVFLRREIDLGWLQADAALCLLVAGVDLLIACLAAQGPIMAKRRHEPCLKFLVTLRLVCSVVLFAIYAYAAGSIIDHKIRKHLLNEDLPHSSFNGWGWVDRRRWVVFLFELLILLRLVIVIPGACFLCAVMIPKDQTAAIATATVKKALYFMGVGSDVVAELIGVLVQVIGVGTSEFLVPSDLLFGLALVAARQRQGAFYCDEFESDEDIVLINDGARSLSSKRLPPSAVRASWITGVNQAPVPLKESQERDVASMQEIIHFVPYSIAIYGAGMELFTKSVYKHTSLVSPIALCSRLRAFCNCWLHCCCCCRRRRAKGAAKVYGDSLGLHEEAFQRILAEEAEMFDGPAAELLWATWENNGPLSAPPFALVLDHRKRCLVVCVRGTMDVKDCIADLGAVPKFFDPFGVAEENAEREAPFDDDTDYFAHCNMIICAKDAFDRIKKAGVMDTVLQAGGRADGWDVVFTGHSLGAGVATILALMFRGGGQAYSDRVRAVVFEPPGGLLSKKLSDLTGELGFVSAVCANDWISRLSIRGVQDLRERILDEVHCCGRSKWQLLMLGNGRLLRKAVDLPLLRCLCCLRWPLRALSHQFVRLGGGPLRFDDAHSPISSSWGNANASAPKITRKGFAAARSQQSSVNERALGEAKSPTCRFFNEMWPPASVVYFRPTALEWWCCGSYQAGHRWVAEWIEPQDLHEIIISARSVELHFPNILRDAYLSAAYHLGIFGADIDVHSVSFRSSSTSSDDTDSLHENDSGV